MPQNIMFPVILCSLLPALACAKGSISGKDASISDTRDADPNDIFPAGDGNQFGERRVIVHLFEWPWNDVATECETVLGPAGALAVQVSPPTEHAVLDRWTWFDRYQPIRYSLGGRGGGHDAFVDMIQRCQDVNVNIYVDVVLNHMSGVGAGVGSSGSPFERYHYPDLYSGEHFHNCKKGIDWADEQSNWNCDLSGLPDLNSSLKHVQETQRNFLNGLLQLGVKGFRVDAAKHIAPVHLRAILDGLDRSVPIYQEIIGGQPGDAVLSEWYYDIGHVTDFDFGLKLSEVFRSGTLDSLQTFGLDWGLHPSVNSLSFIDNHDNQRGHGAGSPLTFKDKQLHRLANIFAMAWVHGQHRVMSSFHFDDKDAGPPRDADDNILPPLDASGQCRQEWACEHRNTGILGMMGFRNATNDAWQIENWWSNGNDRIAFSRQDAGFVVINREEAGMLQEHLQTGLVPGQYCDVITGGLSADGTCVGTTVDVDDDGRAHVQVGPVDAIAIHRLSRPTAQ